MPRQAVVVGSGAVPPSRRLLPRPQPPSEGRALGLFGAVLHGVAGILSEPVRWRLTAAPLVSLFACG